MENEKQGLTLNQETIDVLVANIIPTTKYFESRFDHMQYQIDEIKQNQVSMQQDIDKKFDAMQQDIDKRFDAMQQDIDKRFEQVDKRFEQVDKRFEEVNKKFEQMNESIIKLTLSIEDLKKSQETTIRDYIIERDRFYDSKFNQLRNYNIAIISVVAGVILKMAGIIHL